MAYADTVGCLGGPEVRPPEVAANRNIRPTPEVLQRFLERTVTARDIECFYDNFQAVIAAVRPFPESPKCSAHCTGRGTGLGSSPMRRRVPPPPHSQLPA